MLKRKICGELKKWKDSSRKKCLLLHGARQVGKTFAVRMFASENYDELLEINFKETPSAADIFAGELSVEIMIMALGFRYPEKKIVPGRTLLFFDEIQECPEAVTSLKFWTQDGRYDVIASTSMLGIDYKRSSSYPVGYVEYLHMYGLDTAEFYDAMGVKADILGTLRDCFERRQSVPLAIHNSMMGYFRLYAALGGMPEVVQRYVDTRDFREADQVQRELLKGYQYDIAHYANAEEKVKAEKCFLSLGRQLLDKENQKFQYKEVEHGGRAQKYYSSIEWLLRADIVRLCKAVTDVRYDLDDYARNDFFRAYTGDLSLLIAMKDFFIKQHIVENTITKTTKGGFFECVVADILIKKSYSIYFYKNETTRKEIDFLIQKEGNILPIEVKSGHAKSASLNALMKSHPEIPLAYKLADSNTGTGEDRIVTLPLYMGMFL